jgi:hypothetical protein
MTELLAVSFCPDLVVLLHVVTLGPGVGDDPARRREGALDAVRVSRVAVRNRGRDRSRESRQCEKQNEERRSEPSHWNNLLWMFKAQIAILSSETLECH